MYFRLLPDCFLVEGHRDGVIYDVSRGRLFALDEDSYRVLRRCEGNEPLEDWIGPGERLLLDRIRAEGLGVDEEKPALMDKMLLHAPLEWKGFCLQAPRFQRCDWTISSRCSLACGFCARPAETIGWQACQTCVMRERDRPEEWFPDDVDRFVDSLAGLEVQTLHLRGGDPLLEWERLVAIARAAARQPDLRVVFTTPGTGAAAERVVELCREHAVMPNVMLFGATPEAAALACGSESAWAAQVGLIDALRDAELLFFATVVLGPGSEREAVLDFAETRWHGRPSAAEILDRADLENGARFSHVVEGGKTLTPWRSMEQFYFRIRKNNCLEGNFEIGLDGLVRPCAGLSRVCGSIRDDDLRTALASDDLYELWALDKGQIEPCSGCALRYACSDCTAVELGGAASRGVKQSYCTFDPQGPERIAHAAFGPAPFLQVLRSAQEVTP